MLATYRSNDADTAGQYRVNRNSNGIRETRQGEKTAHSLLADVTSLSEWNKLGVALSLSLEPLRESITKAVEKTLSPQLFYTVIAAGLMSWAFLAANPEPVFTKAAAIVSALMLTYLGAETFLEVVVAVRELKLATDEATTYEELDQAGQRFANRVGPEVARVAVLAVTIVVSQGMTGGAALLASRLAVLPSYPEAVVGASRVGISLMNVGQVTAVAVVGKAIVISLPATAVSMAISGNSGKGELRTSSSSQWRPTRARRR
ncbi:hypothetical protein [Cystobacter fuscus]|uniref:hypothetical protein n=1 Tax=Cystobacter fuscus TaxID=43 RepID=UPI0012FDF000|nr:hypothetical protein [Cystobacter fuscus]